MALLTGGALARSRFPGWLAAIFSSIYGIFTLGWQLSLTLDPALLWRERALNLWGRVRVLAEQLAQGEPSQDALMFVLLMGALYWALGSLMAWAALRQRAFWLAVIPTGLVLLIESYFYFGPARLDLFLAAYVFLALLLAVWFDYSRKRERWHALRARVSAEVLLQMARAGLLGSLLLVGLAWAIPASAQSPAAARAWQQLSQPLQRARERVGNAFSSLRAPVLVVSDFYDDVLEIDAGVEPADVVVMLVRPDKPAPSGGRFYWRARAYNHYERGAWSTDLGVVRPFNPAEGDLPLPPYAQREEIEVVVEPQVSALRVLYVPAQPLWVDRSAEARLLPDEEGRALDVMVLAARGVVYRGERYAARASVAAPSAAGLRAAGEHYPDWVLQNYLQVPASISQETRDLAREITEGLETPYDKTLAITTWLRRNIRYSRVTETPPQDQDPVDWILHDYRVGFCNYYASAEVIMLRTLGIPARLAVGYARGTYLGEEGVYEVRGEDAHAWPEVFFPGFGWVEFEPTVSQPPLIRPEDLAEGGLGEGGAGGGQGGAETPEDRLRDTLQLDEPAPTGAGAGSGSLGPLAWLLAVLLPMAAGALWWFLQDLRARERFAGWALKGFGALGIEPPRVIVYWSHAAKSPAAGFYVAWSTWMACLGLPLTRAQTPSERLALFCEVLPAAAAPARELVAAYEAERFGGRSAEGTHMRATWRALRPLLLRAWLRACWERLTKRHRRVPRMVGERAVVR